MEEHPGGDAILNNAGGDSTVGFYGSVPVIGIYGHSFVFVKHLLIVN